MTELIAKTVQSFWQGTHSASRTWESCCEKLPAQADWFRRLADRIAGLPKTETIVAAALKIGELTVSAPPLARHHTLLHALFDFKGGNEAVLCDQGFLTSTGRYVGREEALQIAVAAGQITGPKYQPTQLFSEDLW